MTNIFFADANITKKGTLARRILDELCYCPARQFQESINKYGSSLVIVERGRFFTNIAKARHQTLQSLQWIR
jgi:hypothetical protein